MRKIDKLPSCHSRPPYVTAFVHEVELRRALIVSGSSLNIMPLLMLEVMGIPRGRIIEPLIEV